MFSSTIQILKLEQEISRFDDAAGNKVVNHYGRCLLLDDAGEVLTVGRLRIPRDLVDVAKVGTFRAVFALGVPDFGKQKGDIIAMLTGLTAVVRGASAPAPAASKAAP